MKWDVTVVEVVPPETTIDLLKSMAAAGWEPWALEKWAAGTKIRLYFKKPKPVVMTATAAALLGQVAGAGGD